MRSLYRALSGALLIALSLLLGQCGDIEKALNNERDVFLYGAIGFKIVDSTGAFVYTAPDPNAAATAPRCTPASTGGSQSSSSASGSNTSTPDRCFQQQVAEATVLKKCPDCQIVSTIAGTTEKPVCGSIVYVNDDKSVFGIGQGVSSTEAQRQATANCDVKLKEKYPDPVLRPARLSCDLSLAATSTGSGTTSASTTSGGTTATGTTSSTTSLTSALAAVRTICLQ